MTQYTIVLTIPNAGNREICYPVNLTGKDAAVYPSDYFRSEENRSHLRQAIENVHYRKISDQDLDLIIRKFLSSIKSGFRGRIPITIDLPPLGTPTSTPSPTPTPVSGGYDTRGNGGNSTGGNSHYPPPKPPNPPGISGTSSGGQSKSSGTGNTQPPKEAIPKTEIISTSNEQLF